VSRDESLEWDFVVVRDGVAGFDSGLVRFGELGFEG
jgi:hypothetical protein